MNKITITISLILFTFLRMYSQEPFQTLTESLSGLRSNSTTNYSSLTLAGNENTYYPVAFQDNGWNNHEATILEIGRSSVHTDKSWNGSVMVRFRFHLTRWGHGSSFIDADIKQNQPNGKCFIGGWQDITATSNGLNLVVWLRGGATYYYHSNYPQNPIFTNNNITIDGVTCATKMQIDPYVNSQGTTLSNSLWVNTTRASSFTGNVGIGTTTPQSLLDVAGTIRAHEVKVEISAGADHVFNPDYDLKPLSEVETFIQEHKHLPEIPSEKQMQDEGLNMNQFQIKLLQKIEELTLYTIEQSKQLQTQQSQIQALQEQIKINNKP